MGDKAWLPISELAGQVNSGKVSAKSLVEEAFKRAKNESAHALLEIIEERALQRANGIDAKINTGANAGRLAGVPFIAKDNFLTFDSHTTAASNILENFQAPYQSEAIERLEAEGAVCIAKANLDAFAHGTSTENSDFGPSTNPHNSAYVPGGSSGGSAAATALFIAPFALGTDTGGSIRLPSSYCGVVGFKPTYGLIPRYGVVAMASSTDVIGPIATRVADAALALDVMAGSSKFDSTTIDRQESYVNLSKPKKLSIGVIKEHMDEGVDEGVREKIQAVIDKLSATANVSVKEVSLPSLDAALACYYVIVPAEVSSNLARYDGIKFGYSFKGAHSLEEVYTGSRSQGFGLEAKRRIMIGNYVLSSGYYDAYYKKAMQVRTLLIQDFNKAFNDFDVLVGPVAPTTAFKLGENVQDPLKMYLVDIMTVAPNLTGAPAISVPIGMVSDLPVGLHIIGAQRSDATVLSTAALVEGLI